MPNKKDRGTAISIEVMALQNWLDARLDRLDRQRQRFDQRIGTVEEQLKTIAEKVVYLHEARQQHEQQFEVLLTHLSALQVDLSGLQQELRLTAEQVVDDHEGRLWACESRLGLSM